MYQVTPQDIRKSIWAESPCFLDVFWTELQRTELNLIQSKAFWERLCGHVMTQVWSRSTAGNRSQTWDLLKTFGSALTNPFKSSEKSNRFEVEIKPANVEANSACSRPPTRIKSTLTGLRHNPSSFERTKSSDRGQRKTKRPWPRHGMITNPV